MIIVEPGLFSDEQGYGATCVLVGITEMEQYIAVVVVGTNKR